MTQLLQNNLKDIAQYNFQKLENNDIDILRIDQIAPIKLE